MKIFRYIAPAALAACALSMGAQTFQDAQGLNYEVLPYGDPNTCTVADNHSYAKETVIIPATVNYNGQEYKVISISSYAFGMDESDFGSGDAPNYSIRNLDLSDASNLRTIDEGAFMNCIGLQEVDFKGCTSLTSINKNAFAYCNDLSIYSLPSCPNLAAINEMAFMECYELVDGDFSGSNLVVVNHYAFWMVYLPEVLSFKDCTSLSYIGEYAFQGNDNYSLSASNKSASFPVPVQNTLSSTETFSKPKDSFALSAAGETRMSVLQLRETVRNNLSRVSKVEEGWPVIKTEYNFNSGMRPMDIPVFKPKPPKGTPQIRLIDLSGCSGLNAIGMSAFESAMWNVPENFDEYSNPLEYERGTIDLTGCTKMSNVDFGAFAMNFFPNVVGLGTCTALTAIQDGAFALTNLGTTDLSALKTLSYVGQYAFQGIIVDKLIFSGCEALGKIDNQAFAYIMDFGRENIISFADCPSYFTFGTQVFYGSSLTKVDFSNSALPLIGLQAFAKCWVKEFDFTDCKKLVAIQDYAFNVDDYNYPPIYTTTEKISFRGCSALKSISNNAFYNCSNLKSIDFTNCNNLVEIGNSAFLNCYSLEEVDLSGCTSLSSIGNNAFNSCVQLTDFPFSNLSSLERIGQSAFYECEQLANVDLSGCSALQLIDNNAFSGCRKLETVNIRELENLETIGNYAFDWAPIEIADFTGCKNLVSLGMYAFQYCPNLRSVIFKDCENLANIYYYAFLSCRNLEYVDFSGCSSLHIIQRYSFNDCGKLETLVLPKLSAPWDGLAFEENTFAACQALKYIVCLDPEPITISSTYACFSNPTFQNGTLFVPAESLEKYQGAPVWSNFYKFQPIGTVSEMILPEEITIYQQDGDISLQALFAPQGPPYPVDLKWTATGIDGVATFSEDAETTGKVIISPKGTGSFTLTAKIALPGYSQYDVTASCKVNIEKRIFVESIKPNAETVHLYFGDAGHVLDAEVYPENATTKDIEWEISDPSIVSINKGVLKAVSKGECEVHAKSLDGSGVRGIIKVITHHQYASSARFENDEMEVALNRSITLVPESADPFESEVPLNSVWKWVSSKPDVASVDQNGVVTGLIKGRSATIMATTNLNGKDITAKTKVFVTGVPVTALHLDLHEATVSVFEDPKVLKVTYEPEDAEIPDLLWNTTDKSIADATNFIPLQGRIKPYEPGHVTITVSLRDNRDVYDTCEVTITTSTSAINDVFGNVASGLTDVYDLSGRVIMIQATKDQIASLRPGVYILRQNNESKKVMIK